MFEKFIAPSMKDADIVVPWGESKIPVIYCIFFYKKHLYKESVAQKIKREKSCEKVKYTFSCC